ncbi:MAG: hypothetical protein GY765_33690 [bacterium]|nr:hypothetical protein [bacterium]
MTKDKKNRVIIIVLFFQLCFFSIGIYAAWKPPIALQPIGKVSPDILRKVAAGITKTYCNVEVIIRPEIPLDKSSYYKPRKRYRALKLLYYLEQYYARNVEKRYAKLVGITGKDISVTKGSYHDWGIFGLAFVDGAPCVISTFRLHRGAKSEAHFMERLVRVVVHEMGHTFGLHHCPTKGCIMEDARGTIRTVDESTGKFCSPCGEQLFRVLCK